MRRSHDIDKHHQRGVAAHVAPDSARGEHDHASHDKEIARLVQQVAQSRVEQITRNVDAHAQSKHGEMRQGAIGWTDLAV